MLVSWLCRSPFKSCKSWTQTEALNRSIRRNLKVRGKMHAFGNCTRGKHFIGGNSDLDHGFVRQEVGVLVLHCCNVLNLHGRDDLPPMNSPDWTNASGQDNRTVG